MESSVAKPMIFVTGASRSGTTMLTRMLGRHSSVAALREMQYFGDFCDPRRDPPSRAVDRVCALATLSARQRDGILAAGRRRSWDPSVQELLDRVPEDAGAAEIFASAVAAFSSQAGKAVPCEQTPRNIYYAAALLEWYPRARVVHVLRDPRGVMASQKYRWRRRSLSADPSQTAHRQQLRTWVNYHPYTVVQLWTLATRRALELEGHPRVHLLKFEDLILEPESRMCELCEFLGIEFEPAMLDIEHLNSSYVSANQSVRGLSRGVIDAWRDKLSNQERALVHERCGELMERLGYTSEPVSVSSLAPLKLGASYVAHLTGAAVVNPRRLWIQARGVLAGSRTARNGAGASGVGGCTPAARVGVFGLQCVDVDLDAAARDLVGRAVTGRACRVAFVNAHTVNVSVRDPQLARALRSADVVYADGVGMALAARLQGQRLHHNVNGTDLFPYLCRHAAAAGVPIAMLGAAPGVARACVEVLAREHPALQVSWFHHGHIDPVESGRLIDEVNRSGAGILLVAMGVPRQERWLAEHAGALKVPVVMGVGGLFDFVSGRVPRAPRPVRALRLEWLFRLTMEPRRLFGRYVLGNPAFLVRACRYAVTGRTSPMTPREVTSR